jgi:DNA-binding HxlR family transcriptional regulator
MRIPALSDKVLAQRLRDLEELGLVLRHKRGAGGSRSRYELTPRGESLRPVLQALYDWGELIAPEVGAFIEPAQHPENRPVSDRVHAAFAGALGENTRKR